MSVVFFVYSDDLSWGIRSKQGWRKGGQQWSRQPGFASFYWGGVAGKWDMCWGHLEEQHVMIFFFFKHGVDGCTRIYTITFKRPTVLHFFFLSLLYSRFKKKKKIITCLIITRLLVFNQNMPVQKLFILHSHLWLHCRAGRGGHSSNPAANSLSTPNKDKQIAITSLWFLLCICTALY